MYKVIILKTPEKYLKRLSGKIAKSIAAKIDLLINDPYPPGSVTIQGKKIPTAYVQGITGLYIQFMNKK